MMEDCLMDWWFIYSCLVSGHNSTKMQVAGTVRTGLFSLVCCSEVNDEKSNQRMAECFCSHQQQIQSAKGWKKKECNKNCWSWSSHTWVVWRGICLLTVLMTLKKLTPMRQLILICFSIFAVIKPSRTASDQNAWCKFWLMMSGACAHAHSEAQVIMFCMSVSWACQKKEKRMIIASGQCVKFTFSAHTFLCQTLPKKTVCCIWMTVALGTGFGSDPWSFSPNQCPHVMIWSNVIVSLWSSAVCSLHGAPSQTCSHADHGEALDSAQWNELSSAMCPFHTEVIWWCRWDKKQSAVSHHCLTCSVLWFHHLGRSFPKMMHFLQLNDHIVNKMQIFLLNWSWKFLCCVVHSQGHSSIAMTLDAVVRSWLVCCFWRRIFACSQCESSKEKLEERWKNGTAKCQKSWKVCWHWPVAMFSKQTFFIKQVRTCKMILWQLLDFFWVPLVVSLAIFCHEHLVMGLAHSSVMPPSCVVNSVVWEHFWHCQASMWLLIRSAPCFPELTVVFCANLENAFLTSFLCALVSLWWLLSENVEFLLTVVPFQYIKRSSEWAAFWHCHQVSICCAPSSLLAILQTSSVIPIRHCSPQ